MKTTAMLTMEVMKKLLTSNLIKVIIIKNRQEIEKKNLNSQKYLCLLDFSNGSNLKMIRDNNPNPNPKSRKKKNDRVNLEMFLIF